MADKKASNRPFSMSELKTQLEEAEVRAQLSEARARNAEAVLRAKRARLISKVVTEKNVLNT